LIIKYLLMNGLGRVIFILIGIAVILAVVVIYNLTNINVSERIRELSTIKVLGFYDKEVTMYIYRETIILSFIGILFGYLLGKWLHNFIITSLPPTNAMFDPNMYAMNYILSGAIPLIVTLILVFVMHRKIRSVDMLEALKSVD
ncbi:ABC transporter permease, partial [Ligilactobacillus salivarius]|uniref:ABC transporter permease n=1 Tax=Ligilactobacillus salivarius TaxID=1624 RepID=UPI0022E86DBF